MIELIGKKLTQWDTGRYVQVNDDTIYEVHCCREGDTKALNVKIEHKDGVIIAPIPNILLQKNQRIIVYTVEVSGDERLEAERAEAEYWRNISYDEAVATEVRKKYSQDAVEAILNNFLADPTNELFKTEFFALQDYRAECKAFVKEMKAKYA